MKHFKPLLAAIALVAFQSTSASASTFDIQIDYSGDAAFASLFDDAAEFWENRIAGHRNGADPGPIVIDAAFEAIDGPNNILGFARVDDAVFDNGFVYATEGTIRFDTADFALPDPNDEFGMGGLFDVILHEVGHVIGFGILWQANGVYVNESGQYTGDAALEAYRNEFDPNADYVPVDIVNGPGTRNAHWDENFENGPAQAPPGSNISGDLLTGFIGGPTYISETTMQSFVDLGYVLAQDPDPNVVPLPAGGLLLLTVAGGFAFASRRRKA